MFAVSGINNSRSVDQTKKGGRNFEPGHTVKVGQYYGDFSFMWKILFFSPRTGQVALRLLSNPLGVAEAELPPGR